MPPLCVWQVVRVILRAPNAPRCREYEIRQVHEGWRLQFAILVYCGDSARHFAGAGDGGEGRLFHTQIIIYGSGPFDTPCDLTRFNDGVLRANPAAQYDNATTGFNGDVK